MDKTVVQRDGLDLVMDIAGPAKGPTVVLLHAGAETREVWFPITPALNEAGWRTIAPDFRGHGESGRAPVYRFEDFLDDTESIIQQRAGKPLVIVGGSIGGAAGLVLTGEDRIPANGLVLLDLPTSPTPQAGLNERDKIQTARERNNPAVESIDSTFLDGNFLKAVIKDMDRWRRAGKNVQVPTLLVRGTRSNVVDDRALKRFKEDIPNAKVTDLDAGHLVARDQPKQLAKLLVDFLRTIPC